MTAKEWKEKARAKAAELTLPSGMVIRARRPDPLQYAMWNRLPMLLARAAEGAAAVTSEEAVEISKALRELLLYCCVQPAISETPGPDEIHPQDIPDEDTHFLIQWAMRVREAAALRPFRRRAADGGAGGDISGDFYFLRFHESAGGEHRVYESGEHGLYPVHSRVGDWLCGRDVSDHGSGGGPAGAARGSQTERGRSGDDAQGFEPAGPGKIEGGTEYGK